jgi:hypothetical protein
VTREPTGPDVTLDRARLQTEDHASFAGRYLLMRIGTIGRSFRGSLTCASRAALGSLGADAV